MTHADLLARMEMLNAELETGMGQDDETKALLALDVAQDYFESIAAAYPKVFRTHADLTTTANAETTVYPDGLLRLDDLYMVDTTQTPNLPTYQLEKTDRVGGHVPVIPWPWRALFGNNPGQVTAYDVNESFFYWSPIPDAVQTIRYYGMIAQADITARGATFAYKNLYAMPFAAFAVRMIKTGLEDGSDALKALADELFEPAIKKALKFDRAGKPLGRHYTRNHST